MNRERGQSGSGLAVVLALLLVFSVPAVVAPGLGTVAFDTGLETSGPPVTPTVTESELDEGEENTTAHVPGDPPADTSFSVDDAHNYTTAGDFPAQRTTLRGVQNLVNITNSEPDGQSANLTSAMRLARAGMKLQVAQGRQSDQPTDPADVTLPTTATPTHDSPSAAAFALFDRYDVTPTPEQAANIRVLDNLPEPARSELTDVLDAYLGYSIATQTAYADANRTRLRTMADYAGVRASGNDTVAISKNETFLGSPDAAAQSAENTSRPTASAGGLQAAGVEVARVRAAQIRLLEATVDLNTALEQADAPGLTTPASHPVNPYGVQVDPVLSVNLSMHNNTYEEDYRLQIDRGGNDTYNNSAGAAAKGPAALVDLGGMDSYNGRNGGGSCNSVGFLLDAGGSDTYDARSGGTNGGGSCGIGFLLDVSGDDLYTAGKKGTNGGGYFQGVGFLLDRSGNDTYTATDTATNGGGVAGGVGSLIDVAGDDRYTAGSGGVNGGGELGGGFLLDLGGTDNYIDDTDYVRVIRPDGTNCADCSRVPKGRVGAQIDLPATSNIPNTGPTPKPSTSRSFDADLCVEGLRDSCDGDGAVGQREDRDNDSVYGAIQKAVGAAQSGATIEVRPDTYHENVTVTTSNLTLVANHSTGIGDVVIDGGAGTGNPRENLAHGFDVRANATNLSGFIIQNYTSHEIVVASGANRTLIREATVHGSITVTGANGTTIRANQVHQNDSGVAGITVTTSPHARVTENSLTGGGIHLTNSPEATIANNTVEDISGDQDDGPTKTAGIFGMNSTSEDASQNSVNKARIYGIAVTGGQNVSISSNSVRSLSDASGLDGPVGITARGTRGPEVTNNSVTDLTESGTGAGPVGIDLSHSSATLITGNSGDMLKESGDGAGPVGIRLANSTLAAPIAHNEVTNAEAGGEGSGPSGLAISDSTFDMPPKTLGPNNFLSSGGIVISNSTLAISKNTFAENITIVNSTGVVVAKNTFHEEVTSTGTAYTGTLQVRNSNRVNVVNNRFTEGGPGPIRLIRTDKSAVIYNTIENITDGDPFCGCHQPDPDDHNNEGTIGINLTGGNGTTVAHNSIVSLTENYIGNGSVGISATNVHGVTIFNNTVEDFNEDRIGQFGGDGPVGIAVANSTNAAITYNAIEDLVEDVDGNGPVGILVTDSHGTTVANNAVENLREDDNGNGPLGINVVSGTNTTVRGNTIANLREHRRGDGPVGVAVVNGTGITVTNNTLAEFIEHKRGIGPIGVRVSKENYTVITDNSISNLKELSVEGGKTTRKIQGIAVADTTSTIVAHNSVTDFTAIEKPYPYMRPRFNATVGSALDLANTNNSTVRGNTLTAGYNSVVIRSTNSSSELITNNTFDATRYGVHNRGGGVINATHNYWGAPDGPSSPDPTRPLSDPLTKRLADGHGAAVSEHERGGAVANVHFDPFDGTPPGVEMQVEGPCDNVDPDGKSMAREDADNDSVYGTLQSAENAATPDTKIQIVDCTYHQSASIDTPGLVLQSFKHVVFDGENELSSGVTVRANDVTIRGLEFHNYTRAGVAIVDSDAKIVNTIQRGNDNGTVIYGRSTPHLEANWFHNNSHAGVYLAANATVAAPDLTIVRNRIQGNDAYGIHNDNVTAVVNATHNHWGAFDAPSSPPGPTLEDPETGGLANGTGDAVSRGTDPEVANVHFDPYNVVHFRWDIDYLVDDGADCEADFTSLQAAENAAGPDDTVVVCAGTYEVGSSVRGQSGLELETTDLTLRGSRYAPDKPTIRGEITIDYGVKGAHEDFMLSGFRITGSGNGINVLASGDTPSSPDYYGISYGIKIVQNNITGNVRGIHLPDSKQGSFVLVTDNSIIGNLYGFSCTAKSCNHVGGPGSPGQPWKYTVITNNLIGNNTYYGIHRADTAGWLIAINNTWLCGGPSGGWSDPKTGEPADGKGDRVTRNTRFDPFSVTDRQSGPAPICTDQLNLPPVVNNSAPTVERLSVGEVETDSAAATFDVAWTVTDSDDNLKEVRLRLHDDTAGVTDDTRTIRVVGQGSASSTTRLRAPGDDGSGHNYTVELTVEDVPGKTATDAESIQETEPTASDENDTESGWPSTPAETSTPPPGDGGPGPGSQGTGPGSGGQGGNQSDGGGSGEGTGTATSGSSASTAEATNTADAIQVTEQVTLTGTPPPSTPTPPTDTPTPRISPTPEIIPGFGVSAWLIGFVMLVALGAIRRRPD